MPVYFLLIIFGTPCRPTSISRFILFTEMDSKRKNILHDVNEFKKGILYYNKYLECNVLIDDRNMVIFTPNLAAERVSDVKDYIKFTTSDGNTYQCK